MEIFDVVNQNDEVVGAASQKDVYEQQLTHRIAHIMILNDRGDILLQKRGETCSYLPGFWSTSVGGHVRSGEMYEEGARREAQEELGITVDDLQPVGKDVYLVRDGFEKFVFTFTSKNPGPYTNLPGKVSESTFFSADEIKEMISRGEKFHPELLFVLNKYFFKD